MVKKVGVLALQGDFLEHKLALQKAASDSEQLEIIEVRTILDLNQVSGLVIPGGESTTIGKLLVQTSLDKALQHKVRSGFPIYGTCAGAIILANKIVGSQQAQNLKLIDIDIQRNGYGRQLDSFITDIEVDQSVSANLVEAVFIRAPIITRVGSNVKVLASYDGQDILVQEKNILVSTFHPELTKNFEIHRYFLDMIS